MAPKPARPLLTAFGILGFVLCGIYLALGRCQTAEREETAAGLVRELREREHGAPAAKVTAEPAPEGPSAAGQPGGRAVKPALRDGPFGLQGGMTLDELRALGKIERKPGEASWYEWFPLHPHPAFDEYLLMVGSTDGLCKIAAFGPSIPTSPSGKELKAAFDKVDRELQARYGPRDRRELGKPGRTWDASTQWMVGLLKKELQYASLWGGAAVPLRNKAGHLDWFALDAHAESRESGYLSLIFGFDNLKRCEDEDAKEVNESVK